MHIDINILNMLANELVISDIYIFDGRSDILSHELVAGDLRELIASFTSSLLTGLKLKTFGALNRRSADGASTVRCIVFNASSWKTLAMLLTDEIKKRVDAICCELRD